MNIEQQVCSFELARKLKELGVKQESFFYYFEWTDDGRVIYMLVNNDTPHIECPKDLRISAYTGGDLGEMLPFDKIPTKEPTGCFKKTLLRPKPDAPFSYDFIPVTDFLIDENEADCRAKALIWCIENGVIAVVGK